MIIYQTTIIIQLHLPSNSTPKNPAQKPAVKKEDPKEPLEFWTHAAAG